MMRGHVLAVVGAFYGSEAKGAVVGHIADKYDIHVRTGGPQAGHSVWYKGKKYVNRLIPVGWVNPKAQLVLGRGGLINPEVLLEELKMLEEVDPHIRERVYIDPKAGYMDPSFHEQEGGVHGDAHKRIGSTGEGVGPAREARIHRDPAKFQLIGSVAKQWEIEEMMYPDTPLFLNKAIEYGKNVLLEGAQGCGLSLIHGEWPYVTSNDCNAAQMCADAGIPPQFVTHVILVARTLPIRVAGNSGPLKDEITWEQLSMELGRPVEEKTTVTKKIRRIGRWDNDLMDAAIVLNGPTSIALTFCDYIDSSVYGKMELTPKVMDFIRNIEQRFGVNVSMAGTGGQDCVVDLKGI